MENRICFWNKEFIKHMVLTEFPKDSYNKYNNTLFLDLMYTRVTVYIKAAGNLVDNSTGILFNKYFKKQNGKYFQVEQRRLLQTEKRNEGIPEQLAKIIADAYKINHQTAYFFGKNALGIKVEDRKRYLETEDKLIVSEAFFNSISNSFRTNVDSSILSGYWLSRFSYKSKREGILTSGFQFDLENIKSSGKWSLTGENILCSSPSGKKYFHELRVQIVDDYLLGAWFNINTKNIGALQLYIHTNNIIMSGKHLGNSNDNSIQEGDWIWIKIDSSSQDKIHELEQIKQMELISFDKLEANFSEWIKNEQPLRLENIIKSE